MQNMVINSMHALLFFFSFFFLPETKYARSLKPHFSVFLSISMFVCLLVIYFSCTGLLSAHNLGYPRYLHC
jgi:hypothetical protein